MARIYEIAPNHLAYNFERCEETVLVDAYLSVMRCIPPTEGWRHEFENHFFQHGNGVSAQFIEHINVHLRRKGLPTLNVRETDLSEYGRSLDKGMKSNNRRSLRLELERLPDDKRTRLVEHAKAEADRLPAPHLTFERFKERRERLLREGEISREAIRRREALRAAQDPKPQPVARLDVEMATLLLTATDDENLRREIVQRLDRATMIEVLSRVSDQTVKNVLVKQAISA